MSLIKNIKDIESELEIISSMIYILDIAKHYEPENIQNLENYFCAMQLVIEKAKNDLIKLKENLGGVELREGN